MNSECNVDGFIKQMNRSQSEGQQRSQNSQEFEMSIDPDTLKRLTEKKVGKRNDLLNDDLEDENFDQSSDKV